MLQFAFALQAFILILLSGSREPQEYLVIALNTVAILRHHLVQKKIATEKRTKFFSSIILKSH